MRRAAVIVAVLALALTSVPFARADEIAWPKAHLRPRIGWVCAYWTSRATGDFDGNGRLDHALMWVGARPQRRCDENRLVTSSRWHLTVFLGLAGRADRRLPACDSAPSGCVVEAYDFDSDGVDELAVLFGGGLTYLPSHVYVLRDGHIRAAHYRGPALGHPGLHPGPMTLEYFTGILYGGGWGCRTHEDGTRVLLVYEGDSFRTDGSVWHWHRARLAFDDAVFRLLGTGTPRAEGVGATTVEVPPGAPRPSAGDCT
jgi:hypothetical protein